MPNHLSVVCSDSLEHPICLTGQAWLITHCENLQEKTVSHTPEISMNSIKLRKQFFQLKKKNPKCKSHAPEVTEEELAVIYKITVQYQSPALDTTWEQQDTALKYALFNSEQELESTQPLSIFQLIEQSQVVSSIETVPFCINYLNINQIGI